MAAGGMTLNDRTVLVYSIRDVQGSYLLDAAVLLRGRVSSWYRMGPAPQLPPPFSGPRGNGASAGKYIVSIVRTDREVWIDTSMRVPLEDSNVLLLDEAGDPVVPPVIFGRVTISPDLGPGAPSGSSPPSRQARTSATLAALTELQRRLEACDHVADYLKR